MSSLHVTRLVARVGVSLLALLSTVVLSYAATASAPAGPEYALTAWTDQDGLPRGDVLTMAQDLEGFLWVGTSAGLARFDGYHFSVRRDAAAPQLAQGVVAALVGGRDGSLWAGYSTPSAVARLKSGRLTVFDADDGLDLDSVEALAEDRSGDIWAGGRGGLRRFHDGTWVKPLASDGWAEADVLSLYEDRSGRLWAGTAKGVYVWQHDRFAAVPESQTYVQGFVEDAGGAIWVTDNRSVVRRLDSGLAPAHAPDVVLPQISAQLARDSRGQIWVAALGGGLLRVRGGSSAPYIERIPYEHTLRASPRSVFEDRDGNIWVGMRSGGLLRLAASRVRTSVALEGVTNDGVRSLAATPDGSVWVATGYTLNRFRDGRRQVLPLTQAVALHVDPAGRLWAMTTSYLARLVGERFEKVDLPAAVRPEGVLSIAVTRDGTLWLCSYIQGVMSLKGGVLSTFGDEPAIGSRPCGVVTVDSRGRAWVGFNGGGLARFEGGRFHMIPASDVVAPGTVVAIAEDRRADLWVVTRTTVSRYRNDRFTTVSRINGPFEGLVAPFAQDDADMLWMGNRSGAAVVRVDPTEFDKVAVEPGYQVKYRQFDVADGLQGELRYRGRVLAVRAPDGAIWIASGLGVAVIDPRVEPAGQPVASPRIDRVLLDGQPVSGADLPTRPGTLHLEYSSLDLSAASKLRFRYRLEGHDEGWSVVGASREASFANLAPGRYRFRVSATNDGRWSESAVWEFSVAPPFYQTRGFMMLMVTAAAPMLVAGWWLRLRAMRGKYALVVAERARLSREIHDTLLQSIAAIGVELETIATQLEPAQAGPREHLRRLRRQAGHALREARESIIELRSQNLEPRGLCDLLRELAERTTEQKHVQTDFVLAGRPVRCSTEVETQLLRIAQEAVTNAVRHGHASRIEVALEFQGRTVSLRVSDDGRGFSPGDRRGGAETGEQLGLLSMRERAERIRARVAITSSPGHGTTIEATAPLTAE